MEIIPTRLKPPKGMLVFALLSSQQKGKRILSLCVLCGSSPACSGTGVEIEKSIKTLTKALPER